jgi:ferredoxin
MADKNAKYEQNIRGSYYVDDSCIACDACCVEAPRFFAMNDDEGHAYVKLQPMTAEEKQEAENALAACPVEAIGNDGE